MLVRVDILEWAASLNPPIIPTEGFPENRTITLEFLHYLENHNLPTDRDKLQGCLKYSDFGVLDYAASLDPPIYITKETIKELYDNGDIDGLKWAYEHNILFFPSPERFTGLLKKGYIELVEWLLKLGFAITEEIRQNISGEMKFMSLDTWKYLNEHFGIKPNVDALDRAANKGELDKLEWAVSIHPLLFPSWNCLNRLALRGHKPEIVEWAAKMGIIKLVNYR